MYKKPYQNSRGELVSPPKSPKSGSKSSSVKSLDDMNGVEAEKYD